MTTFDLNPGPVSSGYLRRVSVASSLGTVLEWYDFSLYATASAAVFPAIFFKEADPFVGGLASFATLALGYFARPLGALVGGHLGDRIGRKKLLIFSMLTMGVASALIGVLPTSSVLSWAAALLLLLRLIQGFALGTEAAGAIVLVVENAPPRRRGLFASFVGLGAPLGNLLGTGIFAAFASLPSEAFMSWGWRVPFLLSIVLAAIGLAIRFGIHETSAFQAVRANDLRAKLPLWEAMRRSPRAVLSVAGVYLTSNLWSVVIGAFSIALATSAAVGASQSSVLLSVVTGFIVEVIFIPVFGALSDQVGRRVLMLVGTVALVIWTYPYFQLIKTGDFSQMVIAQCVAGLLLAAVYGPLQAAATEAFPTRYRYSGNSLANGFFANLVIAPATVIMAALLGADHTVGLVVVYVGGTVLVSAIAVVIMRESRNSGAGDTPAVPSADTPSPVSAD
nr:MFS transporter [Microbacterium bovistercoris]